jgi:ABC-2 type transport system permease protein
VSGSSAASSGPGGSIYDLGYQAYEGPRLGRRSAVLALFAQTVRSCFGIGRGGRAKIAPLVLAGLAILPAVLAALPYPVACLLRGRVLFDDAAVGDVRQLRHTCLLVER